MEQAFQEEYARLEKTRGIPRMFLFYAWYHSASRQPLVDIVASFTQERLNTILHSKFTLIPILGDGDCLFHAVGLGLMVLETVRRGAQAPWRAVTHPGKKLAAPQDKVRDLRHAAAKCAASPIVKPLLFADMQLDTLQRNIRRMRHYTSSDADAYPLLLAKTLGCTIYQVNTRDKCVTSIVPVNEGNATEMFLAKEHGQAHYNLFVMNAHLQQPHVRYFLRQK